MNYQIFIAIFMRVYVYLYMVNYWWRVCMYTTSMWYNYIMCG